MWVPDIQAAVGVYSIELSIGERGILRLALSSNMVPSISSSGISTASPRALTKRLGVSSKTTRNRSSNKSMSG